MKRSLAVSLGLHVVLLTGGLALGALGEPRRAPAMKVRMVLYQPPPRPPANPPPERKATQPKAAPHLSRAPAPAPESPQEETQPEAQPAAPEPAGEMPSVPIDRVPALGTMAPPVYPNQARRRGWEGLVRVEVTVDSAGSAVGMTVVESSGHPILDEAALASLRKSVFLPGSRDGIPEAGQVVVSIRFRLDP